jgi:hypothetical protein
VRFLRSWAALTGIALGAGIAGAAIVGVGPKIAADPELHRQIVFNQILIFGSVTWLLLAALRLAYSKWERNR